LREGIVARGAMFVPRLLVCVWLLGSGLAHAQPAAQAAAVGLVRPTAVAVRIEATEAPVIDGDLSDPVWSKARVIDQFTQKQPNPGAPPTERTELRILYDENNLYFGVYNHDSQPDAIIARTMSRDGALYTTDSFVIQLDPGQTRRNAFSFEVGASGGRVDEVELNNTQELSEWDTIWTERVRRVSDGWVAEVAIPFRSLSYDAAQADWGFDFSRRIYHKNERVYWSGWNPTLEFTNVSQNGNLTGIRDVNRGFGLDVQIYGVLRAKHNWQLPGDGPGISFTEGGNAFYKITPALTDTLTVNPDFSDAPLDVRQVNTTRFSLFTPETRDFFLQDVAAFEFGGRNFARNSQDRGNNNGRPFFSRNIGLSSGTPVSLVAGDKLSGSYGGFDIGALTVLTDKTPTSPGQVLSVARVTHPLFSESRVGFVFTNGDPTGLSRNTVAGLDFEYLDSNFLGRNIFQADAYYEHSSSSKKGNDDSAAVSLAFPNEPWGGDIVVKQVGSNFAPALGFINRTNMRQYQGALTHLTRYRQMFLNQLEFGTEYMLVTDLGNRLESREDDIYVRAASTVGDEVLGKLLSDFEAVPDDPGNPFKIAGRVPVTPGRYDWTNFYLRFRSFQGRSLSTTTEFTCCSFYNGSAIHPKIALTYRPNAYFEFVPTWDATFIDLPSGSVDIHLLSVDSVVNFTPDMQVALQAQYDNISRNFGFSARYRWEYQPGNEIFVAIGQAAMFVNNQFIAQTSLLSIRLGHTFRF